MIHSTASSEDISVWSRCPGLKPGSSDCQPNTLAITPRDPVFFPGSKRDLGDGHGGGWGGWGHGHFTHFDRDKCAVLHHISSNSTHSAMAYAI